METIKLNRLLQALYIPCVDERVILGISDYDKDIEKDWLFVIRHSNEDISKKRIKNVLDKGGIILCDQDIHMGNVYVCEHIEYLVQTLIELYYGDMCSTLCVIGVTGTSGKTSVSSFITQLLAIENKKVLQIGTGFVRYHDVEEKTKNTTPGCFQLAHYFQKALALHIPYVVMEVSSHSIDQNRINFIHFDMILYTNITQDHLDYHLTKTHYRYTKFKLRRYLKPYGAIIYNADMPYMEELLHLANYNCLCFGNHQAHFPIRNVALSDHDISFDVQGYHYHANLLGMMNVYNVTEAMIVMRRLGISYEKLQEDVEKLITIAGRMEIITGKNFQVWLDYAHTSDALKSLLEFAASVKKGRVISLIGCGGERDVSKRSIMGDIASLYSDISIYTSDNPRGESVYQILSDMCPQKHDNVFVFENRGYAIKHCVKIAQKDDIIIIAGKGNEDTITIHGIDYPFSDRAYIHELLYKEELEWK